MKPRTQEPSRSDDLFRWRLENIINLRHELALLGERIDWALFDDAYEAFYSEDGRPGIATRMMVGLQFSSTCSTCPTTGFAIAGCTILISTVHPPSHRSGRPAP